MNPWIAAAMIAGKALVDLKANKDKRNDQLDLDVVESKWSPWTGLTPDRSNINHDESPIGNGMGALAFLYSQDKGSNK